MNIVSLRNAEWELGISMLEERIRQLFSALTGSLKKPQRSKNILGDSLVFSDLRGRTLIIK